MILVEKENIVWIESENVLIGSDDYKCIMDSFEFKMKFESTESVLYMIWIISKVSQTFMFR